MVSSTTTCDGVFFERPQSRGGLSRVDQGGVGAFDFLHVLRRKCGDAGEVLEDVERCPLRRQEAPRFSRYPRQRCTVLDVIAVFNASSR